MYNCQKNLFFNKFIKYELDKLVFLFIKIFKVIVFYFDNDNTRKRKTRVKNL